MNDGTSPTVRSLLRTLEMPRWYLQGEASDPEPDLQRDLAAMGCRVEGGPKHWTSHGTAEP
jgi:hypothetical protein